MQYVNRELQPKKKKQVKCTKGPSRSHRKCNALREETAVCCQQAPEVEKSAIYQLNKAKLKSL